MGTLSLFFLGVGLDFFSFAGSCSSALRLAGILGALVAEVAGTWCGIQHQVRSDRRGPKSGGCFQARFKVRAELLSLSGRSCPTLALSCQALSKPVTARHFQLIPIAQHIMASSSSSLQPIASSSQYDLDPTPISPLHDEVERPRSWLSTLPSSFFIQPVAAAGLGLFIGALRGGRRARLRFLAENMHRQPKTVQGLVSAVPSSPRRRMP